MNLAKRRAYQEKADAELRAWNARVDELLARAEAQKAAGKIELHRRIEKLGKQRAAATDRLKGLSDASDDAWNDVRKGFEQAIHDLSGAFHSAANRFRAEAGETSPSAASTEPPSRGTTDSRESPRV